jgi:hypothetical protein
MKVVSRLVWLYFTGTPLNRAFTVAGIGLIVVAGIVLSTQAQAQAGAMVWIAVLGHIALFVGGSLMSLMVGRLATSHSSQVLPHGRLKLLLSAYIAILLVSIRPPC